MKLSQDVGERRSEQDGLDTALNLAEAGQIRPVSAAAYIADITTELAALARGSSLETLAYLLDIAQLEARNTSRRLARDAVAR